MPQFETGESAFNFAVEYLKKISTALDHAAISSLSGNVGGWLESLRVIQRRVAAKTTEEEDKSVEEDFKEISIMASDKYKMATERHVILYKLHTLEMKLLKLLQKKGMLLPGKSDPRFAILER